MDFLRSDVGCEIMDYLSVGEFTRLLAAMRQCGLLDSVKARTVKRRKLARGSSSFMDYVMDRLTKEFRFVYSNELPKQSLLNVCIAGCEKMCMQCVQLIEKSINEPFCKNHFFETYYPHDLISITDAQKILGRTSWPSEQSRFRNWESVYLYPVTKEHIMQYLRDSNSFVWKYKNDHYIRKNVFERLVNHYEYRFVEPLYFTAGHLHGINSAFV